MSLYQYVITIIGGRGGIRTHGTLAGTPVFKTGALNHSATLPTVDIAYLFASVARTYRDSATALLPNLVSTPLYGGRRRRVNRGHHDGPRNPAARLPMMADTEPRGGAAE